MRSAATRHVQVDYGHSNPCSVAATLFCRRRCCFICLVTSVIISAADFAVCISLAYASEPLWPSRWDHNVSMFSARARARPHLPWAQTCARRPARLHIALHVRLVSALGPGLHHAIGAAVADERHVGAPNQGLIILRPSPFSAPHVSPHQCGKLQCIWPMPPRARSKSAQDVCVVVGLSHYGHEPERRMHTEQMSNNFRAP